MDIINIVFRFFDFFVVIGLAIYAMRHYLIPAVEKLMKEYNVFITSLENDSKNLELQTQSIAEEMQAQEHHFQALQEKFLLWQQKCDEQSTLQKIEQEKIGTMVEHRYQLKSSFIQYDQALQIELPVMIDTITKNLQAKFHGTDDQKDYLDELIQIMKDKA